jgi:hypothetical protein
MSVSKKNGAICLKLQMYTSNKKEDYQKFKAGRDYVVVRDYPNVVRAYFVLYAVAAALEDRPSWFERDVTGMIELFGLPKQFGQRLLGLWEQIKPFRSVVLRKPRHPLRRRNRHLVVSQDD